MGGGSPESGLPLRDQRTGWSGLLNRSSLRSSRRVRAWSALPIGALLVGAFDLEPSGPDGSEYADVVRPLLANYCFECHGPDRARSGLRFDTLAPDFVAEDSGELWELAADRLGGGHMPPETAEQPTDDERRVLLNWLQRSLEEAERSGAERDEVVLRRLTKGQYTHALQELLGIEADFGRSLPDDGLSEMGFSNNGEVLLASQLHLETYQEIARSALERVICLGERPEPVHYRVTFGTGLGADSMAATTGGYEAVPLPTEDFALEILGADGQPREPRDAEEKAAQSHVRSRISVGLRGSSEDRFHLVDEGLILYGALPHREVPPGAWQGPSPNVKLELQRVFPREGEFVLRVNASRGYLVRSRKELLIGAMDAEPLVALGEPERLASGATEPTGLGEWFQAGPVWMDGRTARGFEGIDWDAPFDPEGLLLDGETPWISVGDIDGQLRSYPPDPGVLFLSRTIRAPSARRMEVALGSDDGLWVWLNGDLVLERDVQRGLGADQDFASLDLVPGENRIVLKVVNDQGGFGSYFRVVHDGTSAGDLPYTAIVRDGAFVVAADRSFDRQNLRTSGGWVEPVDVTAESAARFAWDGPSGIYQIDLVHPASELQAMGAVRLRMGNSTLHARPISDPDELARGVATTTVGAAVLNGGRHVFEIGGPFFVGFGHLVLTPLSEEHELARRLEAQLAAKVSSESPALRAFLGTRTDDGMDYRTFDQPTQVQAPLGDLQSYEFRGRLEDLPIPEPESGDREVLSGFLVAGVWNDHLVKDAAEPGAPLLIDSIELETRSFEQWPTAAHRRLFPASLDGADPEADVRAVLEGFLPRAFRRPIEPGELEPYLEFWRAIRGEFDAFEDSVREVLVAALTSPHFLFLVESPAVMDPGVALANRLAFFLWDGPPDDELFELAATGQLESQWTEQVDRLLDDPRAERFVQRFTREWLRVDRLETAGIDPGRFPEFTRFVKRDLAEESWRFVHHVLAEDLPLETLVDSDFALLNQNLAEFYGVDGVRGIEFRPVPVDPALGRGGLLSQGAFLAGHSDGREPHPVKRAVWVKEKLLGKPPLPPPPNVPALEASSPDLGELTLKQRIEQHRDNPSCFDCHAGLDPYGIALESYSAAGRLETERMGQPIDARVELPGGAVVDGPAGLKRFLLGDGRDDFRLSVAKHLLAYALGRDVGFADEPELLALLERSQRSGDTLRSLVHAVTSSMSFLGAER